MHLHAGGVLYEAVHVVPAVVLVQQVEHSRLEAVEGPDVRQAQVGGPHQHTAVWHLQQLRTSGSSISTHPAAGSESEDRDKTQPTLMN